MTAPRHAAALAVLTALVAVPVAAATAQLRPEINALAVAGLGAVVGVEVVAVVSRGRELEAGSPGWLRFRAGELLVLALLARAGTLSAISPDALGATLASWWRSPQQVVDAPTVIVFAILVGLWALGTATAGDLDRARRVARATAELEPLERVTRRYLLVTVVVVAALGIHLRDPTTPLVGPPMLASLGYLVLGVVGIAAVRRVRLESRWEQEGVAVPTGLGGAWRAHAGALVAVAALVALVLPTRTGFGGNLLIGMVAAVGRFFASLTHRFDDTLREGEAVPPGETEELVGLPEWMERAGDPDAAPVTPPESPAWVEAAWPFVFWGAVALLAGYLLVSYVRARPSLATALRDLAPMRAVVAAGGVVARWWRWLRGALGGRRRAPYSPAAPSSPTPADRRRRRPRWWPRLGGGSRSAVVSAYLSVLAEAERHGVGRRASETPYEYEEVLAPRLTAAHLELDRLTDLFVEARFSAHGIDDRSAELAAHHAGRVGAALDRLRGESDDGDRPDGPGPRG